MMLSELGSVPVLPCSDHHWLCLAVLVCLTGCSPSPEEQFQRGLKALETGDESTVAAVLNDLNQHPGFADHVRLLVGLSRQRAHDHQAALESFARMDPNGPLRGELLLNAGQSYYAVGRLVDAVRLFDMLAKDDPDSPDAHRWLGIVYYDLGAYDFAISHLSRLTELEPKDFRPYRLLGLMHRDFERDTESTAFYRKALDCGPPDDVRREIIRELALALISQREYRKALDLVDAEPTDVEFMALGARCLLNLGQKEQAEKKLTEAVRLAPDQRSVLMLQAEMFQADNRNEEALSRLRRLTTLDPFDTDARYKLALAMQKLGRQDEYKEEIAAWETQKKLKDRLTKLNLKALSEPFNSELRFEIADICGQLGKEKLAIMWRQAGEAVRPQSENPGL